MGRKHMSRGWKFGRASCMLCFTQRICSGVRKFLCGILLGCSECWTILDFLTQSCSLPLQIQEICGCCCHKKYHWKLVKSPLAQCSDSSQLKSILPKWEKLIRTKKYVPAALESVSHFLYSLYSYLPLRKEFLCSPPSLCRRGAGFAKMYCMYLSVTYLLIITKSMINLSQIGLLSNPNQANAFLSPTQKAALFSDLTSVCTKAHIHSSCRALVVPSCLRWDWGGIRLIPIDPTEPVQWFISSTLIQFNEVIICK